MGSVRTNVLRALQNALGANRKSVESIRSEVRHQIDVLNTSIGDNQRLPMSPELHDNYQQIAARMPDFVSASQIAVELALTDTPAGAANFETFRNKFTLLEELMDEVRDRVHDRVQEVRKGAARTARRGQMMILGTLGGGIVLLTLITLAALRLAQRITADLATSREEAQNLALHDTLTGLPNRAFLAERLREALARATRGHQIGDALPGSRPVQVSQ